MKKLRLINPNTVISVEVVEEEKRVDNFVFICKLTTKESVLCPYNPLNTIKQFLGELYGITSLYGGDIEVSKIIKFVDYYGTIVMQIEDEIREEFDTHELFDTESEALIRLPEYIKENLELSEKWDAELK